MVDLQCHVHCTCTMQRVRYIQEQRNDFSENIYQRPCSVIVTDAAPKYEHIYTKSKSYQSQRTHHEKLYFTSRKYIIVYDLFTKKET